MQIGEDIGELSIGEDGPVAGHVHASADDGLADDIVIGGTSAGQELLAENSCEARSGEWTIGIRPMAVAAGLHIETLAVEFLRGQWTAEFVRFIAGGEKEQKNSQ